MDKDRVVAYMPAKHGTDRLRTKGELSIPLSSVYVLPEFDAPNEGRRRDIIRSVLIQKRRDTMNARGYDRGSEELGCGPQGDDFEEVARGEWPSTI